MSRKTQLISLVLEASGRWHSHYLIDFIDEFFMALRGDPKKASFALRTGKFLRITLQFSRMYFYGRIFFFGRRHPQSRWNFAPLKAYRRGFLD